MRKDITPGLYFSTDAPAGGGDVIGTVTVINPETGERDEDVPVTGGNEASLDDPTITVGLG